MMTLKELIELCILQKDYHLATGDKDNHAFQVKYNEFILNCGIEVIEEVAPAQFEHQPRIPYVLFKPQMRVHEKRPLIVHTHGGPHVRFYPSTPHAEIMYYLAHGFVVVCPNYRGSIDHPKLDQDYDVFRKFENSTHGLDVFAPEDVYAVASHIRNMAFVDATRITLRGGSYGSFTNSHVLKWIATGKFINIFNGVHLAGGVSYPDAEMLPKNIPIFLSHGVCDDVVPFSVAEKLIAQTKQQAFTSLKIFVAQFGDHHHISPKLQVQDVGTAEYMEFTDYMQQCTSFVHEINNTFKFVTPMAERQQLCQALVTRSWVLRQIKQPKLFKAIAEQPLLCPSEAHMQTILQAAYVPGNVQKNIETFLRDKFKYSEELIAKLTPKFVGLIENERKLSNDYLVCYHACDKAISFVYDVYTTFYRSLYADNDRLALRTDHEFLLRFTNVAEFMAHYKCEEKDKKVNNAEHFNDCAVAVNLFLFGSHTDKYSCSVKFYIEDRSERPVDLKLLLQNMLKPFNISAELVEQLYLVYVNHYQSECGTLVQFYLPKSEISQLSYPCIYYGVLMEYEGSRNLPKIMEELCRVDVMSKTKRNYIKYLQGRVMVPPHVRLRCNVLREMTNSDNYTNALRDTIDKVLVQTMMNYSQVNRFNRKAPMVRILPQILAYNQLPLSTLNPDVLLTRAIQMRDVAKIKEILLECPTLRYATLTVTASYIKDKRDKSSTPAAKRYSTVDLIMSDIELPFSILYDCYGLKEAEEMIRPLIVADNQLTNQVKVLKRVPQRYLKSYVNDLQKTNFIQTFIWGVTELLGLFPAEERYQFIIENKSYIGCNFAFMQCISLFSGKEIIKLLGDFPKMDFRTNDIPKLIKLVDDEDKLTILYLFKKIIKTGYDFSTCVEVCSNLCTLNVFNDFSYVIKSSQDLSTFMSVLPKEAQSDFAWRFIDKHDNMSGLENVAKYLDKDRRLTYVIAACETARIPTLNVFAVMRELPESDRVAFFEYQYRHMTSDYDASNSIPQLPADVSYYYAKKLEHLLTGVRHYTDAASRFSNQQHKIEFIEKALLLLKNGDELWHIAIVKDLCIHYKLRVFLRYKGLVNSWHILHSCIDSLGENGPQFLYLFIDSGKYKNFPPFNQARDNYYVQIMRLLPDEMKLKFFCDVAYKPTCPDAVAYALTNNGLNALDAIDFIKMHADSDIVKNDIQYIGRSLQPESIDAYIKMFPEFFSKPENVMSLLREIKDKATRLSYYVKNVERLVPIKDQIGWWMYDTLGKERDFALALMPFLKTEREFSKLIECDKLEQGLIDELKQLWATQMRGPTFKLI